MGTRVLMVWLYNNTGKSVFAVALCHAMVNLSIKSLFPGGSYDAERILSLIIVAVAAVVTAIWVGRTSTRLCGGTFAGVRKEVILATMADRLPVGQVGTAADLARAYIFVMQSEYTTGAVVHVDGGHRLV